MSKKLNTSFSNRPGKYTGRCFEESQQIMNDFVVQGYYLNVDNTISFIHFGEETVGNVSALAVTSKLTKLCVREQNKRI